MVSGAEEGSGDRGKRRRSSVMKLLGRKENELVS